MKKVFYEQSKQLLLRTIRVTLVSSGNKINKYYYYNYCSIKSKLKTTFLVTILYFTTVQFAKKNYFSILKS